jgi:protein O-mannosyl-transferase
MSVADQWAGFLDVNPEFFFELALEADQPPLASLDLAAGKFPSAGHALAGGRWATKTKPAGFSSTAATTWIFENAKQIPHMRQGGAYISACLLQFDDRANLEGLSNVHDKTSAFEFIATGIAGPLGRPLALASFVPEAYAWPHSTEVLLRTNILIHMMNGMLVAWFLYLLGIAREHTQKAASLVAVSSAAIWMLMPLLASSTLFIVQRMTTLSAAFTLLGLVGYLYSRQTTSGRPTLALLGMTLALVIGAALGALAKENAALIFLFALAVELTLLDRPASISAKLWRIWFSLVLIAPLVTLVTYLISALPYPESVIIRRDFNGFERLITQAEILWKYLYLAFIPHIPSFGPFHDDYLIKRNLFNPTVLTAAIAWSTSICLAALFRRKAPLFSFAVSWYLLGHLLESTTLDLELYFEHRNYIPLVGPAYAFVALVAQLKHRWPRLVYLAGIGYSAVLWLSLYAVTSLWGSPTISAEIWSAYKPQSARAVGFLAGSLMEEQGDPYAAERLLKRYILANPSEYGVQLQRLFVSCQLDPASSHEEVMESLKDKLSVAPYRLSIPIALDELYKLARDKHCYGLKISDIYRLAQSLLENPAYNVPAVRHNIHALLAAIAIDERDSELALQHLEDALDTYHNPITLSWAIAILNSAGRHDTSRKLLEEAKGQSVRHSIHLKRISSGTDASA